jgi:hypothetical protein
VSWHEDITAYLPPPPPEDERQADLRRDIVDELGDHLSCAMQRELRKTSDERAARRAVLARFGSVKRIAYRLWFDAMKETIMNQRIAMISNAVLAAACIAVAVIAFLALGQSTRLNAALLEKLESLQASASSQASEVWANLTINVRENRTDGEPVADYDLGLVGKAFNANDQEVLTGRTDDTGRLTFGPVRPGRYRLSIGVAQGGRVYRRVTLYPGQENTVQVITPIFSPRPAPVSVVIDLPEDLRNKGLWCWVWFDRRHAELGAPTEEQEQYWMWRLVGVLMTPGGEIADVSVIADRNEESQRDEYPIGLKDKEGRESFEADRQLDYVLSRVTFFRIDQDDEGLLRRVHVYRAPRRAPLERIYSVNNTAASSMDDTVTTWRIAVPQSDVIELQRRLGEVGGGRSTDNDS